MIEVIGLSASLIVLLSFLYDDGIWIRLINMVGCILFVVYGVLLGAFSIWFMNGIVFFIHIYKLHKLNKEKKIDSSKN